jgi:hypothetical protein
MEFHTRSDQCIDDALAHLRALREADARRRRDAREASYWQRIVGIGGFDPYKISARGRRTLAWLCRFDDDTVDGVVELLTAARMAAVVDEHRAEIARKTTAWRQAEAATEAAMARYDERWGTER